MRESGASVSVVAEAKVKMGDDALGLMEGWKNTEVQQQQAVSAGQTLQLHLSLSGCTCSMFASLEES